MTHSTGEKTQEQDSCIIMSDRTSAGQQTACNETNRRELDVRIPSLYIATPTTGDYISRGFCYSLRNMFIPFPDHHWEPVQGRNIPDARNAGVYSAIHGQFDYVMQLDADQRFSWDFCLELLEGIESHEGPTIVTGWAKCKSGMFAGQPNIFRKEGDRITSISEAELQSSERYIEIDSFGTSGFMARTETFSKIDAPWFADLNVIHPEIRVGELYAGTEFVVGQDIFLSNRLKQAGVKLVCATRARMPHERVIAE